jgi:PAS domain S-box-containing protein
MTEQAHTLLESVIISSRNTLMTNWMMEDLIEERLLNNANIIRNLYESGQINQSVLHTLANQNNLYRINIFSADGRKIFSSHQVVHEIESTDAEDILKPIFTGEIDTLFIGLREARYQEGFRLAVAVAARDRSAIVVNMEASQLLEFRKQIGFGSLLRDLQENPGILYVALQDSSGILAASGNVEELEKIKNSDFLSRSLVDSLFNVRTIDFQQQPVLEAIHPFYFEGEPVGLFRLGISLAPLQLIKDRIYRRLFFISLILLAVGFIMFTLLIIRQNLEITRRQYQAVETYSRNIIQNVSDAIIVLDQHSTIKVFNRAAESLIGLSGSDAAGKKLSDILIGAEWNSLLSTGFSMQETSLPVQGKIKNLLISKSNYETEQNEPATILVLRDLTEQKRLEAQVQRQERLTALGELASGVAHEIRNPLNAIGTVVQQLDRDFQPVNQPEEYHQLARLVYQEVKRINATIENFLKFARPPALQISDFELTHFFHELEQQYRLVFSEKEISHQFKIEGQVRVSWDFDKMKQVFQNLIQNGVEALRAGDEIIITAKRIANDRIEIVVEDNGPGIPADIQAKIFNLYFTTKASGTGIGLSIVQQIIDQHKGLIALESQEGKGTRFILKIPGTLSN